MAVTLTARRIVNRFAEPSRARADAILVGVFALLVSVVGAGRPSLWLDEAATMSASTRSLPELLHLLGHVDAVHGLYYVVMHGWFAVFPATEFWARVPSSLLIGAAASGVVVLGRQLSTRSVALASGVVFAILPRTTWAGIEARSYALSIFDAVWLTVLIVVAVRRDRVWIWTAYAVALAVATVGNVFVLFVVAAHAVVVIGLRRSRRAVGAWLGAVAVATAAAAPFLQAMKAQQAQVDWIVPVGPGTIGQILGDQYLPAVYSDRARATGLDPHEQVTAAQVSAAVHAWALVLPVIAVLIALVVAAVRARRRTGVVADADTRVLAWTAVAWMVGPTGVLICYSLLREPVYQPHYLAFTVPGLAVVIGMCAVTVGRTPRRTAVILVVLAVAAVPNYVAQRGPYAKFGEDYSRIADLVATHAKPNECLVVDDTLPADFRSGLTGGRPGSFTTLKDYGQDQTALARDSLFESRTPIASWGDRLRTCPGLWTITAYDESLGAHEQGRLLAPGPRLGATEAYRIPAELGFRVVERWQLNLTQVVRSEVRAGGRG